MPKNTENLTKKQRTQSRPGIPANLPMTRPSPISIPNPEGPNPPLPNPIPESEQLVLPPFELPIDPTQFPHLLLKKPLREGCYLIRYSPKSAGAIPYLYHYDGTLRVQKEGTDTTISGDLYHHMPLMLPIPVGSTIKPSLEPNPASGIPIFRRDKYRYYISVTKINYGSQISIEPPALKKLKYYVYLEFNLYAFDYTTKTWKNTGNPDRFNVKLWYTTAPVNYPDSSMYLEGDVMDASGKVVSRLSAGWVSPYFRRAIIEVDKVSPAEWPLSNGAGESWETVFNKVGWKVIAIQSKPDVPEPSGSSWSDAELHSGMLTWRNSADLDTEWRYHLLCVQRLDSTTRGIMYDAGGTDSNKVPREGAGESSHWTMQDDGPAHWGLCEGKRFGECQMAYFRAAIHEIGHAMLLYHPFLLPSSFFNPPYSSANDNHLMQVSPNIAINAISSGIQFPTNIEWDFAPWDREFLKHLPDISVRPGGIPFQIPITQPISPGDTIFVAEWLNLEVSSLLDSVPLGAPVRVNLSLTNKSDNPATGPVSLNIKNGNIIGSVIDPTGVERTFSSIVQYLDTGTTGFIEPGENISESLTLLRGRQGALFPVPGPYQIIVNVIWNADGQILGCSGEGSVIILPPEDTAHAKVAYSILSTPDTLLTLAIGGDHIEEGIKAVHKGLDDSTLRPHYAFIEAKRLGERFGKRKPDVKAVAALIDDKTVMSQSEIRRAVTIIKSAGKDVPSDTLKHLAKILNRKAESVNADSKTREMLRSL